MNPQILQPMNIYKLLQILILHPISTTSIHQYPPNGGYFKIKPKVPITIAVMANIGERKMPSRKSNEQFMLLDDFKADTVIESFNKHIKKSNCEYMSVDISFLNIMDAMKVSTLCATNHYMKYPNGKINWYVSSPEVERFSAALNLGNSKYLIKK